MMPAMLLFLDVIAVVMVMFMFMRIFFGRRLEAFDLRCHLFGIGTDTAAASYRRFGRVMIVFR